MITEAQKLSKKKYIKNHPEKVKEWRKTYLNSTYGKKTYLARQRAYDNKKRRELIQEMGGECIKCGFDDWRALQIDHINGGGTNDNKIMRNFSPLKRLKEIIKNKDIIYQLLCANCNWIKRYEQREVRIGNQSIAVLEIIK